MADGCEMVLMASSFKRTARPSRIRNLLSYSVGYVGSPDWSNKGSDLCRSMDEKTVNISGFTCCEAEECGERWCHRWSVSGLGLVGNMSPYRPGLSSHMLWRCVCVRARVSTFIHFHLSNTTLTDRAIHYFAPFHHEHTAAEVWTDGSFSLSELCEQMLCVFSSACTYACVRVGRARRSREKEHHLEGDSKDV